MPLSKEQLATITRLYHAEGWKIGSIAQQLALHPSTVKNALDREGTIKSVAVRPRMIDPFKPFLIEQLENFPTLTASNLFNMVVARGYGGKISQFRDIIRELRPRKKQKEAFLRLTRIMGEEAQVDWAHFSKIDFDGFQRPLVAFVMTLSYSRAIFIRFFVSQGMSCFLRGHEYAFNWFQGVPRNCLYDNLKSVVLERVGSAIKFNPQFMDYATSRRFNPRVAAPARGNEKGRVERSIQYIRSNFFAGRSFKDIEDLNQQALQWCETVSLSRQWQEDQSQSVGDALIKERALLLALSGDDYPCEDRKEVSVRKTPYITFDLNEYSVPFRYVQSVVTVFASENLITVMSGTEEIARHQRRYTKGKCYEILEHIQELKDWKRRSQNDQSTAELERCIGSSFIEELFKRLSNTGYSIINARNELKRLLRMYGTDELRLVVPQTLDQGECSIAYIKKQLEQRRMESGRPAAMPLELPAHAAKHNLSAVKQHDLKQYEQLTNKEKKDNGE